MGKGWHVFADQSMVRWFVGSSVEQLLSGLARLAFPNFLNKRETDILVTVHQQDDTLLDGLGDLASLGQLELVTPDMPNNF